MCMKAYQLKKQYPGRCRIDWNWEQMCSQSKNATMNTEYEYPLRRVVGIYKRVNKNRGSRVCITSKLQSRGTQFGEKFTH